MTSEQKEEFLAALHSAILSITEPRYFESERGFQGALIAQLEMRLAGLSFADKPIIEQEYQKTFPAHGITIRPDILLHVPFERGETQNRWEGNFVALELKLRASAKDADDDFSSLSLLALKLSYPLTIFLNIDSSETYFKQCPAEIAQQTVCCAVRLEGSQVHLLEDAQ